MSDTPKTAPDHPTLVLFGAPTDIGARFRGGSMGPEALRVAGLGEALEAMGLAVQDWGNAAGPINPNAPPDEAGYRHLSETIDWCRHVHRIALDALEAGHVPILLGGDHSLAFASIAAAARHAETEGRPLAVLWLDAHTDFNTSASSPTGNLHGMVLASLTGTGPDPLLELGHRRPVLDPANVVLIGARSVDEIERRLVLASGLKVYDMRQIDERGMGPVMAEALARLAALDAHVHVSFDVDFIDPLVAPGTGTPVKGGPTYREAQLCMEMIYDSGLMRSLDIVELNPALDHKNQTAELVVELVRSLFGEQILARSHPSADDAPGS